MRALLSIIVTLFEPVLGERSLDIRTSTRVENGGGCSQAMVSLIPESITNKETELLNVSFTTAKSSLLCTTCNTSQKKFENYNPDPFHSVSSKGEKERKQCLPASTSSRSRIGRKGGCWLLRAFIDWSVMSSQLRPASPKLTLGREEGFNRPTRIAPPTLTELPHLPPPISLNTRLKIFGTDTITRPNQHGNKGAISGKAGFGYSSGLRQQTSPIMVISTFLIPNELSVFSTS